MYIGPFFLDTKELFLLVAVVLLCVLLWLGIPLWWFDGYSLLTIAILALLIKGLLPAVHNEAFFTLTLITILLSLYLPFFHLVLFYILSFLFFRLLRVI
jgi:hypothetical protein